jgi:hypothetical protein
VRTQDVLVNDDGVARSTVIIPYQKGLLNGCNRLQDVLKLIDESVGARMTQRRSGRHGVVPKGFKNRNPAAGKISPRSGRHVTAEALASDFGINESSIRKNYVRSRVLVKFLCLKFFWYRVFTKFYVFAKGGLPKFVKGALSKNLGEGLWV